jgi:hypothetical protein
VNNKLPVARKALVALFSVFGFTITVKCPGSAVGTPDVRLLDMNIRPFIHMIQHKRFHQTVWYLY